ncbi:MAG: hypothetical protein WAU11_12365, partial [Ignavibacteriaceae bacterium]
KLNCIEKNVQETEIINGYIYKVQRTYKLLEGEFKLVEEKKIKATSGQLLVSVSEDNPVDELNYNSYYVTIKIKDLRLLDLENNQEILFDDIVFWNVFVGLLPG